MRNRGYRDRSSRLLVVLTLASSACNVRSRLGGEPAIDNDFRQLSTGSGNLALLGGFPTRSGTTDGIGVNAVRKITPTSEVNTVVGVAQGWSVGGLTGPLPASPIGSTGVAVGSNGRTLAITVPNAVMGATACSCDGTGPDGPVNVLCGMAACGSNYTTYTCSAAGWTWTGQVCAGNNDAGAACECTGTGPGDLPVTVACGGTACGSNYTTYTCSAAGWTWTGQVCAGNNDAGAACQCTGTGPGDLPVTVDCGGTACGSDYRTYTCSAAGWTTTGQVCGVDSGVNCSCSGAGPGGSLTAACGQTACGPDYQSYACSESGWTPTGQACDGCQCTGTGPGGPTTVACGQAACGVDYITYSCTSSGWISTSRPCTADAGVVN